MATKTLKKTTKKPQKKIVTRIDNNTNIVEVKTQPTEDDLILGKKEEIKLKTEKNYESPERFYKITNLNIENEPIEVSGEFVETFIGANNLDAREALKNGEREVITNDVHGKPQFKIEVLN